MRRMTTLRSLLVKRDISSHPHVNLTSTKVSHHKHLSIPLNTDINVLKIWLLFCTVHKIYCRQTLMSIASITSQDRGGGDGSACVVLFIRVNPTKCAKRPESASYNSTRGYVQTSQRKRVAIEPTRCFRRSIRGGADLDRPYHPRTTAFTRAGFPLPFSDPSSHPGCPFCEKHSSLPSLRCFASATTYKASETGRIGPKSRSRIPFLPVISLAPFVVCIVFSARVLSRNMDGAPVNEFPVALTHGGRYLQYDIFGNLFEITSKYRPPIMPIGRGAYGIVWYLILFLLFVWEIDGSLMN